MSRERLSPSDDICAETACMIFYKSNIQMQITFLRKIAFSTLLFAVCSAKRDDWLNGALQERCTSFFHKQCLFYTSKYDNDILYC